MVLLLIGTKEGEERTVCPATSDSSSLNAPPSISTMHTHIKTLFRWPSQSFTQTFGWYMRNRDEDDLALKEKLYALSRKKDSGYLTHGIQEERAGRDEGFGSEGYVYVNAYTFLSLEYEDLSWLFL
jgi:hypothetical protein